MASFVESGRRLPGQHRHRHGAAGPEIGPHHPRRRRADGPLHPRADGARGRRDAGHRRPIRERLTALVILGVRDEKQFPLIFYRDNCADMALDEDDIDEAFIASAGAVVVTGTHFSRAEHRRRAEEGDPHRQGERPQGGVRRRLPPEPLGPAGHGAGDERYVRSDHGHRAAAGRSCRLRPHRRHRGGAAHRGRLGGYARRRSAPSAPSRTATIVCKRGPMGCVVFPGDDPGLARRRREGPGLPGRGLQRARRGRRLPVRLPARLAARREARDLLRLCQCLRRLRGLAPALLAGDSDLPGAAAFPRSMAAAHRALRNDEDDQPHPLGDDPPAASPTR